MLSPDLRIKLPSSASRASHRKICKSLHRERAGGGSRLLYLHPLFEPLLRRTLGVPLFQEQVMKIGMVAANLTGGEAEELRKAMVGNDRRPSLPG